MDKTVDDIVKHLLQEQAPDGLKVMVLDDGLCYPVYKIKTCYVKPTIDWTGGKCYTTVDKHEKRAIKIMLIE
jgi:hypothetical protein